MKQDNFSFNFQGEDIVRRYEQALSLSRVSYFDVEEFEQITEFYLDNLQISQASGVVEHALLQHPQASALRLLQAKILFKKGHFVKASRIVDRLSLLLQNDIEFLMLKGELSLKLNKTKEALAAFTRAVDLDEDEKDQTCLDIAYLLLGTEQYEAAARFLKKGYAANPQNTELLYELASTFIELDDYDKAKKYLNLILDVDAYQEETWFTLGLILWDKDDDPEAAMEAFDYVTVIQDNHEMAWFFKGQICFKQGAFVKAIEHYEKFGSLSLQSSQADLLIAECYEEMNNTPKAMEFYQKAMEDKNSRFDAWLGLGYCYIELKDYQSAIANFKLVLDERKDFEEAWSGLGDCYFALGNEDLAIDAYTESLKLNPKQSELWSVCADVYLSANRYIEAILFIQEGLEKVKDREDLLFQLAISFYYNQQHEESRNVLAELKDLGYDKMDKFLEFCPEANEDHEYAVLLR